MSLCVGDLLVRVFVNNELLAPYGEHWVYDTPLFGLCLEATRNTDSRQYAFAPRRAARLPRRREPPGGGSPGAGSPPAEGGGRPAASGTKVSVLRDGRCRVTH